MEFRLDNPLDFSDQGAPTLAGLFAAESNHAPAISSADAALSLRRDVSSLILKAGQPPFGLDQSLIYLAINYADRYLSRRETMEEKPWIEAILAVTCLTLAAKMFSQAFSVDEFQASMSVQFDLQQINQMEVAVLDTLNWRMRSITPFAFLDCLLSYFPSADARLVRDLKNEASKMLFQAQIAVDLSPSTPNEQNKVPELRSAPKDAIFWRTDIKLLGFKSSVVAAGALLAATLDLFPSQFRAFESSIRRCVSLDQEEVSECFEIIKDVKMNGGGSTAAKSAQSSDKPDPQ